MAATWTIAIDWDRDGEFSGDDIVTDRVVWVNWFLGFRDPFVDIAQNSTLKLVLDNRDRRFSPANEDATNPLAGCNFCLQPRPKSNSRKNQRSDQIIDALIHEVVFPPAIRAIPETRT